MRVPANGDIFINDDRQPTPKLPVFYFLYLVAYYPNSHYVREKCLTIERRFKWAA